MTAKFKNKFNLQASFVLSEQYQTNVLGSDDLDYSWHSLPLQNRYV